MKKVMKEKKVSAFLNKKFKKRKHIIWNTPPKEGVSLLLVSRGYLFKDLKLGDIPSKVAVNHEDGALDGNLVNVQEVIKHARAVTSQKLSIPSKLHRWLRFFSMAGAHRYLEYIRVVKAISWYSKDIDEIGAEYLNEITAGTSHCVKDEDD